MSSGQMSFWANVFLGKRLLGKCLIGKCPSGQMSFWANVFWADVFWANVVLGKCLWANVSGQMLYGQISGHPVPYGVPQGGGLSPLLFIIFTSDLEEARTEAMTLTYADDMSASYYLLLARSLMATCKAASASRNRLRRSRQPRLCHDGETVCQFAPQESTP
jgi:hypothetical protein